MEECSLSPPFHYSTNWRTVPFYLTGMRRRHSEVLNEFEFECKRTDQRAEAAEKLALGRMEEMSHLEHRQNIALEEYRSMAETEKKIMESKLDELEGKIREQARQLQAEQQRRLTEDLGNYEQQVEFLNSVIVDMQKKNDELRNRVQVLEEIGKFPVSLLVCFP